jgi:hypothetical protein
MAAGRPSRSALHGVHDLLIVDEKGYIIPHGPVENIEIVLSGRYNSDN